MALPLSCRADWPRQDVFQNSTLCSSSRKGLLKWGPECPFSVREHTDTYTRLPHANSWRGNFQKHTEVSVGFKFIFNHIKSNLENWCMGFSESLEMLYEVANTLGRTNSISARLVFLNNGKMWSVLQFRVNEVNIYNLYIYTHTHICICIETHTHICIYVYMHVCVCVL